MSLEDPSHGIPDWRELLALFPPAPPELLARRELRCRSDSKFVMTPHAAAGLLGAITADYAVLAADPGCFAPYRTLYFDTAELDFFHAQRRGRRVRHKVRVRHYADRRVTLLEVKTRRNELQTHKVWRTRAYGDSELRADDQAFIAGETGVGRPVLPQVWTEFRRLTLLGLHANERITVDLDLSVRAGPRRRSLGGVAIIEVKQWPYDRRTPVLSALRAAGRRARGISKYCAAIAFAWPGVRCNRLLPELRSLERAA